MNQGKEDTRSLSAVTIHTIILFLMTVLSLSGNWLVCVAFYRNRRLRTITNFYVMSLSITGIIIATFSFPFITTASGLRKWPFGFNFCQLNGFLKYYFSGASAGVLALTAINRYFCVVKPQFYPSWFTRKKTIGSIIFLLLFTLAVGLTATLSTPLIFQWHPHYLFCQLENSNTPVIRALYASVIAVFIVLPMCLILFCYGRVYRAIRRHNSGVIPFLQEASSHGAVSAHEIQASRVLLAAVIAFCFCWVPTTVVKILGRVAEVTIPSFWQSVHTLSVLCSSWVNPIIYGVMNRAMRKEFLKLLCGRKES